MEDNRIGWRIADIFKQNIGIRMTAKQVSLKLFGEYDSPTGDDVAALLYWYADEGAIKVEKIIKRGERPGEEIEYDAFVLPKPKAGQLLDSFSEYLINRDLNDMMHGFGEPVTLYHGG